MKYSAPYLRERIRKGKGGGKITYYQGILRYKDSNGIWRQITKSFDTPRKKEAKQLLKEWYEEMEKAAAVNPDIPASKQKNMLGVTVKEAVTEFLDLQHTTKKLEDSTYQTQMFYARKHIFPDLGHEVFKDVDWRTIQDWETRLREKLSENTVGICHSILRKTYKNAYISEEIPSNPFEYVTPPKKVKTPINYLDNTGKKRLEIAVRTRWDEGSDFYTAIMLALYSGMRSSEICGLKWADVKLAKGIEMMRVQTAIGRKTDGGTYVKGTKNDSSDRIIPVNSKIYEVLKKRQEVMKKEYAESNQENTPPFKSLYVVGDVKGNYLPVTYLGSTFSKFAKANKIMGVQGGSITMHGLRHTFATDAVRHGMDIKSLASILGHTKADMTLNTYASDDTDAKVLAMKKLADAYDAEEGDF